MLGAAAVGLSLAADVDAFPTINATGLSPDGYGKDIQQVMAGIGNRRIW
jgi:hypothetical protein